MLRKFTTFSTAGSFLETREWFYVRKLKFYHRKRKLKIWQNAGEGGYWTQLVFFLIWPDKTMSWELCWTFHFSRQNTFELLVYPDENNEAKGELFWDDGQSIGQLSTSNKFFPPASAVEGIKSVPSVCACVCLSVIQRSHGWTVWHTDPKFDGGVNLDNISDEFEGQGHRSKVKVARTKKRDFRSFSWVNYTEPVCHDTWHHVTSRHDVMMSLDVMKSWYGVTTSWHDVLTSFDDFWARILTKRARRRRARQRSGVF